MTWTIQTAISGAIARSSALLFLILSVALCRAENDDTFGNAGLSIANLANSDTTCNKLFVDISTDCVLRCGDIDYFVKYCNFSDTLTTDVIVRIEIDPNFTVNSASIPFSPVGPNLIDFMIPSIPAGECGDFAVNISVPCNAPLGWNLCMRANIFNDTLCSLIEVEWDSSNVEVNIECIGDSVYFNIQNNGNGDMSEDAQFIIIEDDIIVMLSTYNLQSGQDTTIVIPSGGGYYYMEAENTPGNPSGRFDNYQIEGCGNSFLLDPSPGFLSDDGFLNLDYTCLPVTDSCVYNNKIGFPTGVGPNHLISNTLELEFQINFQNTSADTVKDFIVCDTLSPYLNINTLIGGASNHDYAVQFPGGNLVKFVFENINLPPGGTGFVKFIINQTSGNLPGTVIVNEAELLFDTLSVLTDSVFYTISQPLSTTVVDFLCYGDATYGFPLENDTIIVDTACFAVLASYYILDLHLKPILPDSMVYDTICEGAEYEIEGMVFTEPGVYTIPLSNPDTCQDLVLHLEVLDDLEELFAEICSGEIYHFFSQTLSTSGSYLHAEFIDSCIVLFLLDLTVHPVHEFVITENICQGDTLFWQGETLVGDTVLTHSFINQYGCDSTETLILTVHPHQEVTLDAAICEGDFFMVGDTSYYSAGSYLDTIETVHGCDSIVHLNLTVLPHSDTSIVAEICEGETYSVGSYVYSQAGTYIDTLPAANNCDSVVNLLLVVQSKDSLCFANAGPDTVLCGYSYHLIGSPEPGTWEIACPTASGVVALEMTGDGEATVKVSSCGGYDFIYTHTHIDTLEIFDSVSMQFLTVFDTCVASDLVKVGFEDPSTREIITQTDMGLVYNDYDCHSGDIVTCTNTVSSEAIPPSVLWKFDLSGTCTSNIYSTNVMGPISDCLASEVEITATTFQGSFGLPQLCLTQDEFITLDSNGQVIENNFWEILGDLFGQGVNGLTGQCPPTPAGCFPPPPCPAEVLGYDTSYLEIPVRTGGQWVYLPDSTTMIFLEDTTDLEIGNMDYRFVIEPNATTYSPVVFKIWRILPNGNLVVPTALVSVTMQWQERWVYDSLEIIHPIYGELPDSCRAVCPRGDIINNQISDVPLPPPFECPPFTVTFGLSSLEVVTNIVCDTTHYLVELTISDGTLPYTVAGLSGNFIATDHFISDPVAMSSGYSAEVMDAEGCVKYVSGESCPCVFLHIETDSFYALSCIDSCVIMTAEVESNISYYQVEWKRPGYSVEGNPALVCGEGTYSVRAYDPFTGCEDKTTTEAGFSFPEADAGENQTITCTETEAVLQGDELTGDTSIVFSWIGLDVDTFNQYQQTLMVDLPGIYELTVTSQVTGCADTDEVTVAIENDPPSVDAGDDARFSCETDTMSLNGSAAGFAISYEWGTADGEIISGGNTPMSLIGMPGTYILVATAISNGCSGSDTVVIKPYEPVLFELEVDNDCENGSAGSVEIVGVAGYAAPYEYSLDSIVFQTNGYFEELSSGNYLVTLRDTNGCVESANALIEKIPMLPALDFAETYHFCGPNDPVLLDAFVDIDAKWVSYFWSTGADTSNISINEAGVQYLEIATSCESMRYEFELVDDLAQAAFFEVPNVFTPNDDGINDIFGPVTPNQPEEFIMYIFDRWGNRVFNTNSFENFWDGTFKNKGVPSDVYIWKIIASYHDCNGLLHSFSLKGDVTLLR